MSTSAPAVAFDSGATFDPQNGTSSNVVVTGTASPGLLRLQVFDGTQFLGTATLAGDDSWSLSATLGPGTHRLTAVATSLDPATGAVLTATAQSPYRLVTGINDQPYADQEFDLDAGGAVVGVKSYDAYGDLLTQSSGVGNGHAVVGSAAGQVLTSAGDDVFTGGGANTRYVFTPGFGHDEITNFTASGASHDILSLPSADLASFAAVLRHTTTALDGSAVIHLDPNDSIKLDGVTKADLVLNHADLRFHA